MIRRAAIFLIAASLAAAPAAAGGGGLDDAIQALFRAARTGNEAATTQAAAALVAFGPEAASGLAKSLADRTVPELVWALRCLREIGSDVVKDAVFPYCSHPNAEVRIEGVIASATLGRSSAVPHLQRAAVDSDDIVRRRAYDGILEYGCGADGTLAIAVNGIVDKDFWVVLQSFQILDCVRRPERGPDRVLVEMAKIVGRLDERNSEAFFDFLVRRTGPECTKVVESALVSEKRPVVIAALKAAARLKMAGAKTVATRLATSSDLPVALAAIDCLSHVNDADSVPVLVDILDRTTEVERIDAIAVALRRMTSRLYGADVSLWRKYLAGQNPR